MERNALFDVISVKLIKFKSKKKKIEKKRMVKRDEQKMKEMFALVLYIERKKVTK